MESASKLSLTSLVLLLLCCGANAEDGCHGALSEDGTCVAGREADSEEASALLHLLARRKRGLAADTGSGLETASEERASLFTSVRCVGSDYNRSCLFRHLYRDSGGFHLYLPEGSNVTAKDIRVYDASKYEPAVGLHLQYFKDEEALRAHLAQRRLESRPGLTLFFMALFQFNIGHALWDSLYGAFMCLVKLGRHQEPRFSILMSGDDFDNSSVIAAGAGEDVLAYLPTGGASAGRTRKPQRAKLVRWSAEERVPAGGAAFDARLAAPAQPDGTSQRTLAVLRPLIQEAEALGEEVTVPASWVVRRVQKLHACWPENVFEVFSGGNQRELIADLDRDLREDPSLTVSFEEFAMGSWHYGNMVMDASGALPGSLPPLQGTRLFRDRMLRMHLGPAAAQAAAIPRWPALVSAAPQQVRAIIIHNRRFTPEDVRTLKEAAAWLTGNGVAVTEYVDWAQVGAFRGDFASHLTRVLDTDVMISSVGTALMYLPFLRDGSAFVALGQVLSEQTFGKLSYGRRTPSFMEQHMSAGTPYVRSLFYDSAQRMAGLRADSVRALVQQAVGVVRDGFRMPVPAADNLSPEGRLLLELFAEHPEAGEKIVQLRNTEWDCILAIWNEYIVYEIGPWQPGGTCSTWATADANISTLRALRRKYGLQSFGAEEF